MTSPTHTLTGHQSEVFAVAWSPDGAILASGARDRTIRLWHMPGGDPVATISDHRGAVHDVAFAPIGIAFAESVLASASADQTVRLWTRDRTPITTLDGHGGQVRALAWSRDGSRLVSAGTFWNFSEIKLWDLTGGAKAAAEITTLRTGKGDLVFCVDCYHDDAPGSPLRIAAGLAPGFVQVWQHYGEGQDSGRLRGHGEAVRALAFAPDGSILATGSSDGTLKLWASRDVMHDPDLLHTLRGHTGAVRAVAFSPDGSCIASGGSDGVIRLWNATSGAAIAALGDQAATIHCLAWSPDGSRIASAAADGIVPVWAVG
jgi:WD40 repeat protein